MPGQSSFHRPRSHVVSAHHFELTPVTGHTAALVVLRGQLRVSGGEVLDPDTVGVFERSGGNVAFDTLEASSVLLLAGEPLAEPVVGSGPFVMNTTAEIHQAIADYRSGRMGRLDQAQD